MSQTIDLLQPVTTAREKVLALIENADLETVAHETSGWTIKDVLTHITFWDEEITNSIVGYVEGEPHQLPRDLRVQGVNDVMRERRRNYTSKRVLQDFDAAYERLKSVLETVPTDKQEGQFRAPWGEKITLTKAITGIADHYDEHRAEIEAVL